MRWTRNKRIPREILLIFDVILVMKRDTWKQIVPSKKGDTMLIFPKMMNAQNKDSYERRMIQMKSMC